MENFWGQVAMPMAVLILSLANWVKSRSAMKVAVKTQKETAAANLKTETTVYRINDKAEAMIKKNEAALGKVEILLAELELAWQDNAMLRQKLEGKGKE